MCLRAHFLMAEAGFAQGGGGGSVYVLAENRESAPHSEAFEGQNNLCAAFALYACDEFEVTSEARFFEDEAGRRVFHGRDIAQR
jgi:hypothetical protein